jgi:hypothetical protein
MHSMGAWRRRGFVIAMLALTFAVVAPGLAPPVGAAPAPASGATGTAGKPKLGPFVAAAKNKKSSSLSLPLLAFLAIAPFVLMGLYLLGADYLRRREPRKRGGASLVITRVSDR